MTLLPHLHDNLKLGLGNATLLGTSLLASVDSVLPSFRLASIILGMVIGLLTGIKLVLDLAERRRKWIEKRRAGQG